MPFVISNESAGLRAGPASLPAAAVTAIACPDAVRRERHPAHAHTRSIEDRVGDRGGDRADRRFAGADGAISG